MDNIGGAEKLALTLAQGLKAEIITTNVNLNNIQKMGFNPKIRSIGRVPKNAPFRHQKTVSLFSKYKGNHDYYIIAGDWALAAAIHNKPNIWYVHSPTRELWDLYSHTRNNLVPQPLRFIYDLWVSYNRKLQKNFLRHTGTMLCNSENTRSRIRKYLKADAKIVYPPVNTKKFRHIGNENFWLSVNRMIPHKRVEMQIDAFRNLPDEKLVIVGSFENARQFSKYLKKIKARLPGNVELRSHVSEAELAGLYGTCKGFITTSKDEDFGMTAIEAMSAGKYVIAPNEGGYRESIIQNKTGCLIDNIGSNRLAKTIRNAGKELQECKKICQQQAEKFSSKRFIRQIKEVMKGEHN